jgi:hypothetical protein
MTEEERPTRPDAPSVLQELWEYLGAARELQQKLEGLAARIESAELERDKRFEDLDARVRVLEARP